MKKTSIIKHLILLIMIISIPIIIYFVSPRVDLSKIIKLNVFDKFNNNFVEDTIKTISITEEKRSGMSQPFGTGYYYTPDHADDGASGIILGTLSYGALSNYDWHYSYTVRAATYCCDSYWPLIKVKDTEFGTAAAGAAYDHLGDQQAYEADQEFSRLPNRNGHLVNIEYAADGGIRSDIYKGITYLKWQGMASDYNIQRVLWSSWVWYVALGYGVDYMGDNYVLENKGVHDETAYETVQYYCGRDSYVPSNIEPHDYNAHVQYSYGGPSAVGKDSGWVEPGVVDYWDSGDTNGDGIVSVAEQLAPYGGSVEAWRAAVIAGIEATYGPLSRTIQFATFEYQIIRRNFPVVCIADDIHAYVDQDTSSDDNRFPSYTFGPYKISMMDGGYNYGDDYCSNAEPGETLKLKELVYNEITGGNFGQKEVNTFLTSEFKVKVKYRNGVEEELKTTIKPKYDDSSAYDDRVVHSYQNDSCKPGGVILVDAEGNALEEGFPKFDETFYIRYFVDDNENTLQELVGSDISFKYMGDEMKVSGYRFKSEKLAYSIHYNLCKYYDKQENTDCFGELASEYSNFIYYLNENNGHAWKDQTDGGEIYIYKEYSGGGDTADILSAIQEVEEGIENFSNRLVTSKDVTVTWGDTLTTHNDTNKVSKRTLHCAGGKTVEQDRCDGIYIEGCQLSTIASIANPYGGSANYPNMPVSNTGKGFFPEYDNIDTFYDNQKDDFLFVWATARSKYELLCSFSEQTLSNPDMFRDSITIDPGKSLEDGIKEILENDITIEYIDKIVETTWATEKLIHVEDNQVCSKTTCTWSTCPCNYCRCTDCKCAEEEGETCTSSKCSWGCKCTTCYCSQCKCYKIRGTCACNYHILQLDSFEVNTRTEFRRDICNPLSVWLDGSMFVNETENCTIKSWNYSELYSPDPYLTISFPEPDNNIKFYDMYYESWEEEKLAMETKAREILIKYFAKGFAEVIEKSREKLKKWIYHQESAATGAYAGLYIPYITPETEQEGTAMPFVEEDDDGFQPMITSISPLGGEAWHTRQNAVELPGYEINMFLGGNVTEEEAGMKGDGYNNVARSGGGVEVSLYNEDLKMFVAVTTTDQYGNYGFQYVNPLHQYKVVFKYNGMQYLMNPDYSRDISDPGNAERRRRRKSKRSRKWN